MTDNLIAFLRARIDDRMRELDEDERVAGGAAADSPGPWLDETGRDANGYHEGKIRTTEGYTVVHVEDQTPQPEVAAHIARWDPARVLRHVAEGRAEVEVKRRMLDRHSALDDSLHGIHCAWCSTPSLGAREPWPCPDLRDLAQPYASHPDYREEWRP